MSPRMAKKSVRLRDNKKPSKKKRLSLKAQKAQIKGVRMEGGNAMNRIVRNSELFGEKKDITIMSEQERREYLRQMTKNFLKNAKPLMDSLKDK